MSDFLFAHRLGPSVGNPLAPGGMADSSGRGRPPLRRSCWRPSTVSEVIVPCSQEESLIITEMSVRCSFVAGL